MPSPQAALPRLTRRYVLLAAAVLGLAAFNLTYRLDREFVTEWDESLYAISAWEMLHSGNWFVTTFHGAVDYYNSKPPLNVWLIALSFKFLGVSLLSLRLPSILFAWLTVAVLQEWARRAFGPATALLSSLVLATGFGGIYVHAGRSANTDSLFSLLVLLTVVILWSALDRPRRLAWLGPVLAATFLLKGFAVLMPAAIVLGAYSRRTPLRALVRPLAAAAFLLVALTGPWAVLRWQADRWAFFDRMFRYDFIGGTFRVLEGHAGPPWFYLALLAKEHYDWLIVAAASLLLFPPTRWRVSSVVPIPSDDSRTRRLTMVWGAITLLVPTLMSTKLPWYLNPFYPVFAIWLAGMAERGWAARHHLPSLGHRHVALAVSIVLACLVAESRLAWYSFRHRDIGSSVQGVLLAERRQLQGRRVYRHLWNDADAFVLKAMIGATPAVAADASEFLASDPSDDFLILRESVECAELSIVRTKGNRWLYRHAPPEGLPATPPTLPQSCRRRLTTRRFCPGSITRRA